MSALAETAAHSRGLGGALSCAFRIDAGEAVGCGRSASVSGSEEEGGLRRATTTFEAVVGDIAARFVTWVVDD